MKIDINGDSGCADVLHRGSDCKVNVKFHGVSVWAGDAGCYKWVVRIVWKGESASFNYNTGLGHRVDQFNFADFIGCLQSDVDYVGGYGCDEMAIWADDHFGNDINAAAQVWAGCRGTRDKIYRVFRGTFGRFVERIGYDG